MSVSGVRVDQGSVLETNQSHNRLFFVFCLALLTSSFICPIVFFPFATLPPENNDPTAKKLTHWLLLCWICSFKLDIVAVNIWVLHSRPKATNDRGGVLFALPSGGRFPRLHRRVSQGEPAVYRKEHPQVYPLTVCSETSPCQIDNIHIYIYCKCAINYLIQTNHLNIHLINVVNPTISHHPNHRKWV